MGLQNMYVRPSMIEPLHEASQVPGLSAIASQSLSLPSQTSVIPGVGPQPGASQKFPMHTPLGQSVCSTHGIDVLPRIPGTLLPPAVPPIPAAPAVSVEPSSGEAPPAPAPPTRRPARTSGSAGIRASGRLCQHSAAARSRRRRAVVARATRHAEE